MTAMTTLLLTLAFTILTTLALVIGIRIGKSCECNKRNQEATITHYMRVDYEHITMDVELYNKLDAIGDIWNKEAWLPVHS